MTELAVPAHSVNYGLLPQTWEDPAHKAEELDGVAVSPWNVLAAACDYTSWMTGHSGTGSRLLSHCRSYAMLSAGL